MSFLLTIEQGGQPAAACEAAARDRAKAETPVATAGPEMLRLRQLMASEGLAGPTVEREHAFTDAGALA